MIDQVFKAAGARYEYVYPTTEGSNLGSVSNTAIDNRHTNLSREGAKLGHDLMREFSGRGQHESLRSIWSCLTCVRYQRNTKGERFTRPRGSVTANVTATQRVGHRGCLDLERLSYATPSKGVADGLGNAQLGEGGGH